MLQSVQGAMGTAMGVMGDKTYMALMGKSLSLYSNLFVGRKAIFTSQVVVRTCSKSSNLMCVFDRFFPSLRVALLFSPPCSPSFLLFALPFTYSVHFPCPLPQVR